MISRRDVMGAGLLGSLAGASPAETLERQSDAGTVKALGDVKDQLEEMTDVLDRGLVGPGLNGGGIGRIRERYTTHLRASGKFPDFMEIGVSLFYDVYDWHIRHNQQVQIARISEQRFAVQFMFTQLIVRWEQDPNYLGVPFDRG